MNRDVVDRDLTPDAVLVIPGIMGSELVDAGTGTTMWGLADARWYCRAWVTGGSLKELAVTPEEREGTVSRIRATRLLRTPAFAPLFRGIEPYSDLLTGLRRVTVHREAVAEFPYDWRLSIAHNAGELKQCAKQHLARWRAHRSGSRDAKLVLVAHSMGGLVARYYTSVLGGAELVRATVTLGTPYFGAAKAMVTLSSGSGAPIPLPRKRLRRLAATLPGMYDLLPSYRCVDVGGNKQARFLTASDVAAVGGNAELTTEAFARRDQLLANGTEGLHALAGVEQPTVQSLVLRDGLVEPGYYTCVDLPDGGVSRTDRLGDSTVYRDAAAPLGLQPSVLPQRHGAIAKTPEAIAFVRALLTQRPLGPPLAGVGALSLRVPDVTEIGKPFEVWVTNTDEPTGIGCVVENADGVAPPRHQTLVRESGMLVARVTLREEGVYRVRVKGGGTSAVSDLVMVAPPADLATDTGDDEP